MEVKRDGKLTILYAMLAKVRGPAPWTCIFRPGGAEQRETYADWLLAFASGVHQFARIVSQSVALM